jgi:hypothetical protein
LTKALTIALTAVFLTASAMASADTYSTLSSPRIIHVPQPGDELRRTQARLPAPDMDDDDEIAVPQRPRRADRPAAPIPKSHEKKRESREPARRKPFTVSLPEPPPPEPEPTGPKRALLSAPPPPPTPSIHDGPSPLRPTPRFGQPLPEAPAPLTTFTPPATPKPVAAVAPAPEPLLPPTLDDNDDHLPPPGDPRLAPPEPKD